MRPALALALTLAFLAPPAWAQPDIRSLLISAGQAGGCVVTEEAAEVAFGLVGIDKDQVRPVAEAMIAAGEARIDGSDLVLSEAVCGGGAPAAPDSAPSDPDLVVTAFRAHACTLQDQAGAAGGLAEALAEAARPRLQGMIAAGEVTVLAGGALRLNPPLCAPPAAPNEDPLDVLLRVFRENGCVLNETNGKPLLEAAGLTEAMFEALEPRLEAMMTAGQITRLGDAADSVRIEEPLCSGGPATDPSDPLIRMLRDNGCRLTEAEAKVLAPQYGTAFEALDNMADALMDSGRARGEGEVLILEGCGG